ncbi:Spx/MgsR family RNA polymerase-binding regulatory protein [Helicobacter sp. MIT 05-5294]|uniref:arsenate reductase family protein n=1 Tax=Helicobacter sp. MIT 05-5294 TaxID=1548150 RepID=UPI00051FBAFD|nr:Spx/MgsR family RNA polymerase-binding regulatory protein [Helicobacter sp. MIT 05-5294]TLD87860.1 Spx/MgsR family RNA polymerase-binding regulatory protein [Helicobacter sp. MIT 05-5294]
MVKIYGIKNCGSVKKALNFLESQGIPYEFVDFKTTPPTSKNLEFWLQFVGIEVLLNKKGTTYKRLNLKDKNLTLAEAKEWLIKEPMLIKRPVIEVKNRVIVGFCEESYQQVQW